MENKSTCSVPDKLTKFATEPGTPNHFDCSLSNQDKNSYPGWIVTEASNWCRDRKLVYSNCWTKRIKNKPCQASRKYAFPEYPCCWGATPPISQRRPAASITEAWWKRRPGRNPAVSTLDQLFLFKSKTCRSSEQTEDSSRVKKSYLGSQLSLDPISYGLQALTFGKGCGFSLLIIVFGPGFGESHCFFLWFSQWKQKKCAVDRICKNLAGIKKFKIRIWRLLLHYQSARVGQGCSTSPQIHPTNLVLQKWFCQKKVKFP